MKKMLFSFLLLVSLQASAQLIPVLTQFMSSKGQTLSPGSSFVILFDKTELHEAGNTGSNGYIFKAAIAGLYKMESAITINGGAVGSNLNVMVTRNGVVVRRYNYYISHSGDKTFSFTTDIPMKAGESLSYNVYLYGATPANILEGSHTIYSRYNMR